MSDLLDFRTVILTAGAMQIMLAAIMLYFSLTRRTYPGFHIWTIGYIISGVGALFLGLRSIAPDFVSIVLANLCIVMMPVTLARGMSVFVGNRDWSWILSGSVLAGTVAVLLWAVYIQHNVSTWVVITLMSYVFFLGYLLVIAYRGLPGVVGGLNFLFFGASLLQMVSASARIVISLVSEGSANNFYVSNSPQTVAVLIMTLSSIGVMCSLIILNAHAMERDLKDSNKKAQDLIMQLQTAIAEVKTLSGLFPICASCKKIRDDQGYWNRIEKYISDHSSAEFSHSICPECAKKLYPDINIYED